MVDITDTTEVSEQDTSQQPSLFQEQTTPTTPTKAEVRKTSIIMEVTDNDLTEQNDLSEQQQQQQPQQENDDKTVQQQQQQEHQHENNIVEDDQNDDDEDFDEDFDLSIKKTEQTSSSTQQQQQQEKEDTEKVEVEEVVDWVAIRRSQREEMLKKIFKVKKTSHIPYQSYELLAPAAAAAAADTTGENDENAMMCYAFSQKDSTLAAVDRFDNDETNHGQNNVFIFDVMEDFFVRVHPERSRKKLAWKAQGLNNPVLCVEFDAAKNSNDEEFLFELVLLEGGNFAFATTFGSTDTVVDAESKQLMKKRYFLEGQLEEDVATMVAIPEEDAQNFSEVKLLSTEL